ncbi:MAG: LacI family DNA-binding transcriptional regulator [Actinobacteria bacterium]|nr:LacI family DNA-binding transcriptional regulator [Actinomycetota bacterium]
MIPKQDVSMDDVARRLGISVSTVSRALRGNPGVAPATRARVVREAAAMSYVVSSEAASSGEGKTGRVGLLVPRLDTWYYSTVVGAAQQALRRAGLESMLYCLADGRDRYEFFEHLPLRRRVDGVIVVSFPLDTRSESRLRALGMPVVVVSSRSAQFASVAVDDRRAALQAVDHLIRAGHRRIGLIRTVDPENSSWAADEARVQGYRASMAAAGITPPDELIATVPWGIDGGARGMELLLSAGEPPTAVFCFSDEIAVGALRTLRRAGIAVPEGMSLVSVDDHPMAELTDLTTVRQPVRQQGVVAGELLVEQIRGGAPRHVQLPTQLVVRHSTRPLG